MQEIFLARQPIVDNRENLMGFELLFRSCSNNKAVVLDGSLATAQVILNAFGEMGITKVLGAHKGFINLDAQFLYSDLVELLPKQQVVLELLETVIIDDAVIRRCQELKQNGYSLALDDVTCLSDSVKPLLSIVDIVKLDLMQIEPAQLPELVSALKCCHVKVLAEKVETREQARYCMELGFQMFQGYYFARPEMLSGKHIPPSQMALIRILTLMMSGADNNEIALVFKEHPNLSYSLLRMVNSVSSGLAKKVSSIKHGLMVLGRQTLLRWVQLLLYSNGHNRRGASPLMQLAATRGKLMELIARHETGKDQDYFDRSFMAGILSLLDTLFEIPLHEVLAHMNLHEEVEAALLRRDGQIGECLALCEGLEQGDIALLQERLDDHPWLTFDKINKAQANAMAWANAIAV